MDFRYMQTDHARISKTNYKTKKTTLATESWENEKNPKTDQ